MGDNRTQQEKLHQKHKVDPRTITTPSKPIVTKLLDTISGWFD